MKLKLPIVFLPMMASGLLAVPALGQNIFFAPERLPLPQQQPPAAAAPAANTPQNQTPATAPPPPPASVTGNGQPQPSIPAAEPAGNAANPAAGALNGLSMFVVTPPPVRTYQKHDLVEIIVNESSVQKIAQKYDNKKDYDISAELSQFPSMEALVTELALRNGIGSDKPALGVKSKNKFKGDGKMDRSDQVTAKISAIVIDVKPNGTLVLEARESIQSDREIKTMVLSGICRSEDITRQNTIQSSQLAELDIKIRQEGDVKDTAEKGLIPRILDTLFNF